jgi:hypothetical protein
MVYVSSEKFDQSNCSTGITGPCTVVVHATCSYCSNRETIEEQEWNKQLEQRPMVRERKNWPIKLFNRL